MSCLLQLLSLQRADDSRDTSFENVSSIPNFFISSPAIWEYGYGIGEPSILTIAGKEKKVTIYEHVDNVKGMFFPIHKTCLDILQRICQIRQAQDQGSDSAKPKTLEAFCDALLQQRKRNFTDPKRSVSAERRYAGAGGIEWPHDYYGARQFWTDEWDTEPGWEVRIAKQCTEARHYFVTDLFLLLAVVRRPFVIENP